MDGVSLVAGIPGLVQSCVHGYRFVCTMIEMDKAAHVMRLKYRIEECRLTLWGRFWGVLKSGDALEMQSSPRSLDDLLRIRGVEALINDILKNVLASLEEVRQMSEKYGSAKPDPMAVDKATESAPTPWRRRITSKIRWALKDKTGFEEILSTLRALNDGLDELLPRQGRRLLGQALIGEVMAEEGIDPTSKDAKALSSAFDERASTLGPTSESQESQQLQADHDSGVEPQNGSSNLQSPQDQDSGADPDDPSESTSDAASQDGLATDFHDVSMQLPAGWFVDLTGQRHGFSMASVRLPVDFDPLTHALKAPKPAQDEIESQQTDTIEESVFIEWRDYSETLAYEELQMALYARREEVSRQFYDNSSEKNHIVMQCLGYVLVDEDIMGLVFRPPAGSFGAPISLYNVLRDDFTSTSAHMPDLEDRVSLAKNLSVALYELQCSGWLHRKISSHNIMFFPKLLENGARGFTLSQPRLVGWQTARQDDQSRWQPSENITRTHGTKWPAEELPYIHPARATSRIRFRRSFDVYSLGIVLVEIAFWEPVDVLSGSDDMALFEYVQSNSDAQELQRFSMLVQSTCKEELAGEVGRKYASAVMWALHGTQSWNAQQANLRKGASSEELTKEIGLEKAFFWHVVSRLNEYTTDDDHEYNSVIFVDDNRSRWE